VKRTRDLDKIAIAAEDERIEPHRCPAHESHGPVHIREPVAAITDESR
jgi:hypothetical protein